MNQILSVNDSPKEKIKNEKNNKTRNNTPVDINKILKIFPIAILIYGILIVAQGSYCVYKEISAGDSTTKPVIYVEPIGDAEISLKITHNKELSQVTYKWNSDEPINIPCEGKKEVETSIEIPKGVNSLTVKAVDKNGQEIEYNKVYNIVGDINIDVEAEGNDLKVIVNGKNTLSYMTYRWDEEEETKIDINSNEFEQMIEIPKGLHSLTIIVVDEKNETETFEQEVNGVTRPNLEVTTDGSSNFVIKASDEQGIKKVEFIINEDEKYMLDLARVLPLEERKEFEYSYPLHSGENKLEVIVYNESDISETFRALVNM